MKRNEHPETFNYRFSTNEVNKASNAVQNKDLDEEFFSHVILDVNVSEVTGVGRC